jgi:hypothetical protein
MSCSFHSIAQHAKYEMGHFFHYHLSCQQAIASAVDAAYVYVPLDTEISHLPEGWRKWFHPIFNTNTRRHFRTDCSRLFQQQAPSKERRIFFLEQFTRRDFRLFALAALLHGRKRDELWILFRDDASTRRKKERHLIRFFSKLLQLRFGDRFIPLTDSDLLAHYYKDWFKKEIRVLPIPHTQYKKIEPFQLKERLTLTTLGPPRAEKGTEVIAQLMKIPDALAARVTLDLSGATLFTQVTNGVQLRLRPALLSQEAYFNVLHEADIVLLPYDAYKYKRRTSGPFVEAIMAGKLPLVTRGSWLAHELERFQLSACIVDWDNPQFFTHLFSVANDPAVHTNLQKMQEAYSNFHTTSHFKEKLQALLH